VLIALTISSLLNIYYLLSIPMTAFFNKPITTNTANGTDLEHNEHVHTEPGSSRIKEAPIACLIGMAIPTLITIYLFFDPYVFFRLSSTLTNF
jgi:multicomponent Na+:H+ antiporter subunit D